MKVLQYFVILGILTIEILSTNNDKTTSTTIERNKTETKNREEKIEWFYNKTIDIIHLSEKEIPAPVKMVLKMSAIERVEEERKWEEMETKLKSERDMWIQRAIHAETKASNAEKDKNDADKYRLLLGLTYRIDYLESLLAPDTNFKGQERRSRWLQILDRKTLPVKNFLKKIHDAGMNELTFAECIEKLCDERNQRAGHARIPIPRIVDEKTIEGALAIMEIIDDKPIVETVKIIASRLEDLDLTSTTTTQKS